jgi:hypothetical protein
VPVRILRVDLARVPIYVITCAELRYNQHTNVYEHHSVFSTCLRMLLFCAALPDATLDQVGQYHTIGYLALAYLALAYLGDTLRAWVSGDTEIHVTRGSRYSMRGYSMRVTAHGIRTTAVDRIGF